MDTGETQYLFKETRLNLEPPSAASIVSVCVPANHKPTRATAEDESTFRARNLASASTIYHRKYHHSPRSFLWRILDDGTTLSIRVVDVARRDKNTPDVSLVLNFNFATPILPNCVALADPKEHDALCIFVIDEARVLWTLTLRPDTLRRRTAVDAALADVAKRQAPAGLSTKYPHRMVAVDSNMLLVTVNDGGMIRFDRSVSDSGKHTIRHGKVNMEYSAATALKVTSLGVEDCLYVVTVCLDHRLRIWNVGDGQILHTGDILDVDREPQDVGKWVIDPAQSNLVQIVGRTRGQRICATYSPIGAGEFKFWKIVAKGTHSVDVVDLFPDVSLVPVLPSSDVWTLADFVLSSPAEGIMNLWTLWKNNMTYKVQRLPLDRKNMARSWEESWEGVFLDTSAWPPASSGPNDPTDVTEKWLRTILQPGAFTKATLNTALAIYEHGLGTSKENVKGRGIAEAICTVLGSTASLERGPSGSIDYEQFRSSNETQWRRFYRLLVELDRQRGEAISLSVDHELDTAWVICADLVSVVHDCSALERLYYNAGTPEEGQEDLTTLINVGLSFVDGFSDNFVQLSEAALRSELFEESSKTDLERIQYFSDKSGFWRGITDDDCAQVVDALGDNFKIVTEDLCGDVLDLIRTPSDSHKRAQVPLSEFGHKLALKGVEDSVELYWRVCFSQLILLVHMEFEFDNEEDALHNRIAIGQFYRRMLTALRRLELLRWLGRTDLSVPEIKDKGMSGAASKRNAEEPPVITALEANVGQLFDLRLVKKGSLAANLTDLVADMCAIDSEIDIVPTLIQCNFLRHQRADLALETAPFCDHEPFSVYVQGRVFLALQDFNAAATQFRKAAIGLSSTKHKLSRQSVGLLNETDWKLLNNGPGKYYSHIVALYEQQRAYSYVVDFARLAVQFHGKESGNDLTRTDMLSRLFNAAVATSQFQLAHTTLLSLQDGAMRHSNLRKLVDRMCATCHSNELVALSFPAMQQDVDDILTQRCQTSFDVLDGFPYHQVLYSWRIRHGNFRGAASVLLDRIQKLKIAGEGDKITGDDVLDTPVTKQYLLLINALNCVEAKEAWVYDEGVSEGTAAGLPAKRTVVSLADIRKQYQDELDRIASIQNNQFEFAEDDVMELT
ncbi:Nucleoporin-like protein [Emericellopsis cladophorae]|uniref:Nucleoporin-like protein n=1 Tax=Emericellopsis cladophorae TaxID=2686198 RepID=A0A9Q0BHF2_9HYPO|nr:Nucleoporin-like protein [Emericellopsis cladophorae]KAI6786002.1 Nucleoporin-like protein [Emericellopsis cladophorae]